MSSTTHITIIGLGLIGGSIALALKACDPDKYYITGVDNNADTLRQAIERGAVDQSTNNLAQGVCKADIIFLCTPVLQIIPVVKQILPFVKPGVTLTDVGSTKKMLQECLATILPSTVHYVGGHPMAGREHSGIMAADKDLLRNKWYIIIPNSSASIEAIHSVQQIVKDTGAIVTTMDAASHDQSAAVISHIPHVAAAAMVNLLDAYPDPEGNLKLSGGGFRDTTRIASSNADMWSDICMTNSEAIIDGLENLQILLSTVIQAIQCGERQTIHDFFYSAKIRRDSLISASL